MPLHLTKPLLTAPGCNPGGEGSCAGFCVFTPDTELLCWAQTRGSPNASLPAASGQRAAALPLATTTC